MKHINAQKVSSSRIVKQIQKYYSGGYLWTPKQNFQERKAKICAIRASGKSIGNIAEKFKLTERRRIRQIFHGKENKETKLETEIV